jgi:hypothetical protein
VSSSQSASRYRHRSEVRVGQTKTREQVFFWLSPLDAPPLVSEASSHSQSSSSSLNNHSPSAAHITSLAMAVVALPMISWSLSSHSRPRTLRMLRTWRTANLSLRSAHEGLGEREARGVVWCGVVWERSRTDGSRRRIGLLVGTWPWIACCCEEWMIM